MVTDQDVVDGFRGNYLPNLGLPSSSQMVKSKSLFRQPGAQHFQLVHRSLRDPLIHDSEASKHVLKQVIRENDKKVGHTHSNEPIYI